MYIDIYMDNFLNMFKTPKMGGYKKKRTLKKKRGGEATFYKEELERGRLNKIVSDLQKKPITGKEASDTALLLQNAIKQQNLISDANQGDLNSLITINEYINDSTKPPPINAIKNLQGTLNIPQNKTYITPAVSSTVKGGFYIPRGRLLDVDNLLKYFDTTKGTLKSGISKDTVKTYINTKFSMDLTPAVVAPAPAVVKKGGKKKTAKGEYIAKLKKYGVKTLKSYASKINIKTTKRLNGKLVSLTKEALIKRLANYKYKK